MPDLEIIPLNGKGVTLKEGDYDHLRFSIPVKVGIPSITVYARYIKHEKVWEVSQIPKGPVTLQVGKQLNQDSGLEGIKSIFHKQA